MGRRKVILGEGKARRKDEKEEVEWKMGRGRKRRDRLEGRVISREGKTERRG